MVAVFVMIIAVLVIIFITYLLAESNRKNQYKKSKEESKEGLEKRIKNLEDSIKQLYIMLLIYAFAIAFGSIITYSKIKEFAIIISSINSQLRLL